MVVETNAIKKKKKKGERERQYVYVCMVCKRRNSFSFCAISFLTVELAMVNANVSVESVSFLLSSFPVL